MLARTLRLLLPAMMILLGLSTGAVADKRVALLIGNSLYKTLAPLKTPANDVATMKIAFQKAGFDVVEAGLDLGLDDLVAKLWAFTGDAQGADIAAVYYSGHGVEVDGHDFLIPVDASLGTGADLDSEAVALDQVLRAIDGASRLKLVLLDASRDNPAGFKPVASGNSATTPPLLLLYAVKAGQTIAEGDEPISAFAGALAANLFKPGVDIQRAASAVRDHVVAATKRRQEPFVYGALGGEPIFLAK